MTKEEAARLTQPHVQEILLAYAQGKTIEYSHSDFGCWIQCVGGPDPHKDFTAHYRIKPRPRLRPWTAAEVPVGALLRGGRWSNNVRVVIISVNHEGVGIPFSNGSYLMYDFQSLTKYEYSTDFGKTWQSCGILTHET